MKALAANLQNTGLDTRQQDQILKNYVLDFREYREITLFATRNSANDFPRIIRMIEQGLIDTSPWITHRMTLLDVPALFPDLPRQRDCVKAMIEVPGA